MNTFKDVMHHFVGVEMKMTGEGIFRPNNNSRSYKGIYNGCVLSPQLLADFADKVFDVSDFKPYLIPLNKMSEADAIQVIKLRHSQDSRIAITSRFDDAINYLVGDYLDSGRSIYFNNLNPEQFQFLLSKHYDLWNLISTGEAIDAYSLGDKNPYK